MRSSHVRFVVIGIAVVCVVGGSSAALAVSSSSGAPSLPKVAANSEQVVTSGPSAYPAAACLSSSDPTKLLLPITSIPNMVLGTPNAADGPAPLFPNLPTPQGATLPSSRMSAASISGHEYDASAPASAIQSADPFNTANPHVVTSFDETIMAFSNENAESLFYGLGTPPSQAPSSEVGGQLVQAGISIQQNVSQLPSPNTVAATTQPGTDAPGQIQVTVEVGNTVYGLGFFGGSSLDLADVVPYVESALGNVNSNCGSSDILPGS